MNLEADNNQLALFAAYAALGILCAAIFHLFYYPISRLCKKRWLSNIVEGLLGLGLADGVWWFNLMYNDGQFRFYIVPAFFVGVSGYLYICRPILDKAYKALYNLFVTKRKGDDNAQDISQQKT